MKTKLVLLLTLIAANTMWAAPFKSAIIMTTPLTINVQAGHFVHVRNFTQEGGSTRGELTVTINSETANVLTAALIDTNTADIEDTINQVIVAGPATITVAPVAGATLFISYQKDFDGIGAATPTPTP